MTKSVSIEWFWIDWSVGDTWRKAVLPRLEEEGVKESSLERCVYLIRANGMFAIEYPKGISPTLYTVSVKVVGT